MDFYRKFSVGSLLLAQYKLSKGTVLSRAELAATLRTNPGEPLPRAITEHLGSTER
jgi:hypothetical protein